MEANEFGFLVLSKKIEALETALREHARQLLNRIPNTDLSYESAETNEIAKALAKFNAKSYHIVPTKINPRYSTPNKPSYYASIWDIMIAINPGLSENELSITQIIKYTDGAMVLHTKLRHSSGQWIESRVPINDNADIQKFGAEVTYKKRYALTSLLSLAVPADPEDDDGEELVKDIRKEEAVGITLRQQYPGKEDGAMVTPEQKREIDDIVKNWPHIAKNLYRSLGITSTSQIPAHRYHQVKIQLLENIKIAKAEAERIG